MKILKIAKAGSQNIIEEPDGEAFFSNDLTPFPYLTLKNYSELQAHRISKTFDLSLLSESKNDYLTLCKPSVEMNYKQKTLVLTGAAILASHLNPSGNILLTTENRLRLSILNALVAKNVFAPDRSQLITIWMQSTNHFSIDTDSQFCLHEAGLMTAHQDETLHFNAAEMKAFRDHFFSARGARQNSVKVGA